jgi:hypothetical protein
MQCDCNVGTQREDKHLFLPPGTCETGLELNVSEEKFTHPAVRDMPEARSSRTEGAPLPVHPWPEAPLDDDLE